MASSQSQWNNFVLPKYSLRVYKLYFNKYAYKVSVNVINGSFLRTAKTCDVSKLSRILSSYMHSNEMWPQGSRFARNVTQDNSNDLSVIINFVSTNKIKNRIESSTIDCYTETADELVNILNFFKQVQSATVSKIYTPDDSAPAMSPSIILVKSPPKFKFKVFVANKAYSVEKKIKLLNFLKNYPDDVYIPKGLLDKLESPFPRWLSGMYYYVNDDKVFTFLTIIDRDFVKKIYTLVFSG